MSWENALLMKLSNGVEKYEIEVTKMPQNYSFFLTVNHCSTAFFELAWEGQSCNCSNQI